MTKQRESGVSEAMQAHLRRALPRSWWVKIHTSPAQPTCLDIVGCWRGWFITIETKVDEGELEPTQEAVIPLIERSGALVVIFHRHTARKRSDELDELAAHIRAEIARKEERLRGQSS